MAQSVSVKEQPKTKKVTTSTTALKMSSGAPTAATTVASVAVAAAVERAKNNGSGMSNSSHHHHHANASSSMSAATTIGTKPTLIEVGPMRFLIMDAPRQANLHIYIKEMAKHQVSHVVRVCEPTYNGTGELQAAGMKLHEMEYKDGTSPSRELIFAWLKLVEDTFYATATPASTAPATESTSGPCIAVHCVAGLGRAPVLVALALIELHGMDPVEAVTFLRQRRRGAINEKQLLYLEGYKKQYKRTYTGGSGGNASTSCCVIL